MSVPCLHCARYVHKETVRHHERDCSENPDRRICPPLNDPSSSKCIPKPRCSAPRRRRTFDTQPPGEPELSRTTLVLPGALGNVECLRLLHEIHSHLPIDDDGIVPAIQWQAPEVCEYAVKSGNLETLEVAWSLRGEHYDIMFPFPEGPYPMLAAIKIGRLDMIKFLLTKGCPWGRDTCEAVRNAGHPHVSLWVEKNLGVCPSITVDQVFGACSEHGDGL